MSDEKRLSPGQIAYRKALAKKGLGMGGVPLEAVPEPKQTEAKHVASKTAVATCSICGKPLTRIASASQGMGDICAAKVKLLPQGISMADHYTALTELDVPEGFILLREAILLAKQKGCSGYRFIQACGGDRMLRLPFNEHFKVVFVSGKRYISALSVKDLALLIKV